MSIASIASSTATDALRSRGASSASGAPKAELGQDAFLTLMLAQLRNQDPLKPLEPQEFLGADFPAQSQPLRAHPKPIAGYALPFVIVITDAQVFLEVTLRVGEAVLRLRRDHAPDTTRTVSACCVVDTIL